MLTYDVTVPEWVLEAKRLLDIYAEDEAKSFAAWSTFEEARERLEGAQAEAARSRGAFDTFMDTTLRHRVEGLINPEKAVD